MQLGLDLHSAPDSPPEPKIPSVTELTQRIRALLQGGIGETWVEGEISNLRIQASGHQYFTLKDSSCQLACVLFSRAAAALRGQKLGDGQSVQIFGELSVYEPRGQYQMIVRLVQARGEGALQAKFEALKKQLAAEGLFDLERKRPLPRFPKCIGLVTSPTGAAVRDFLKVLHRRHPGIEVLINPVRVQGRGASVEIARAIGEFGRYGLPPVDVVVVTRGGGSMEDLWEFNEEIVARAIVASEVPVVSAIGHEIDFTIADFAADLRAPTPSAAAEILAADRSEVLHLLRRDAARMSRVCRSQLDLLASRLERLQQSPLFREPPRIMLELSQTLDRAAEDMQYAVRSALDKHHSTLAAYATRMARLSPSARFAETRGQLNSFSQRAAAIFTRELTAKRTRLDRLSSVLSALNPKSTLSRGYTITTDSDGKALVSAKSIEPGVTIRTRFHDGEVESVTAKR